MTTHHPLISQYVYKYIYGEGMTFNTISFDKITDIDDEFITFTNAKISLKNNRWYLSGEVGTKVYKIRIIYSKKGTKSKKDKDKLYEKAIDNLNLKLYRDIDVHGRLPSYFFYQGYKLIHDGFTLEGPYS